MLPFKMLVRGAKETPKIMQANTIALGFLLERKT